MPYEAKQGQDAINSNDFSIHHEWIFIAFREDVFLRSRSETLEKRRRKHS